MEMHVITFGTGADWRLMGGYADNDQTTARYMSERLGEHIVWRKQRTFNQETQKYEEEWMPQGASFLRTGIELGREVSRDSGDFCRRRGFLSAAPPSV
jgi:hypothetical protein